MIKITIIGAGSTVFTKNVLGDCMLTESLKDMEISLYDIDSERLEESFIMVDAMNKTINGSRAKVKKYLGVSQRKDALKDSSFVITTLQVGGYEPCTVTDFEIPKKYGLRQTIGDTLGIGGIFRALRTIPVFESLAEDMQEVCPDAYLLNYVNPMAIITGYMQRFTKIKTIGLCHSVQVCSETLLKSLGMEDSLDGRQELIAGINHMGWLLEIRDKNGVDLYPEIRRRAAKKNAFEKHSDMVRFEYIKRLGYYCTESSEHNAEYNPFFIKSKYPELIEKYNIPLDEYPRRCVDQISKWKERKDEILSSHKIEHTHSKEYLSYILNSIITDTPYKIGGNVINNGYIENLPKDACVEVPCYTDGTGIHPTNIGRLPVQLAAMNMTNINTQLLTIEAAKTRRKDYIYQAAMLDPHTAAELSIDDIVSMCDDLIAAHGDWLPEFK